MSLSLREQLLAAGLGTKNWADGSERILQKYIEKNHRNRHNQLCAHSSASTLLAPKFDKTSPVPLIRTRIRARAAQVCEAMLLA